MRSYNIVLNYTLIYNMFIKINNYDFHKYDKGDA